MISKILLGAVLALYVYIILWFFTALMFSEALIATVLLGIVVTMFIIAQQIYES